MKKVFQAFSQYWQKNPSRNYFILFTAVAVVVVVGLVQLEGEDDTAPCSPTQYFGGCYDVPRALCETTLAVIETGCKAKVHSMTRPGQLVGPIEHNCEQLHFDRILKYTRKSDPLCTERVRYLENWQKSNSDF